MSATRAKPGLLSASTRKSAVRDGWQDTGESSWVLAVRGKVVAMVKIADDGRYHCWALGRGGPSYPDLDEAQAQCERVVVAAADLGVHHAEVRRMVSQANSARGG